jgi:hypothetical protein
VGERVRLGEALRAEGLVDELQLRAALGEQARWGNRLGETLVRMGFVPETELVRVLARLLRVPAVDLAGKAIEPPILDLVPQVLAEKYQCIPLFAKRQGGVELLYLGMDDPTNLTAVDDVSFRTGLGVRPVLVGPVQLRDAIAAYYRGEGLPPGSEPGIAEAPVIPGDTAPVLPEQEQAATEFWSLEPEAPPTTPAVGPPPAPAVDPPPAPAVDPRPAPVEANDASAAPALAAALHGAPPGPKPRDVPTRQILQAVTRLLIEKGVLGREELLERIRAVQREGGAAAQGDEPAA